MQNHSYDIEDDYHNDPKIWDRQAWANSAYPDQTAPSGGFALFKVLENYNFFGFWMSEFLGCLH